MICERCKRRLKPDAIACICGWTLAAAKPPSVGIQCAHSDCSINAKIRVWTRTGWANVCLVHYETAEILPRVSHSPAVERMRKKVRQWVEPKKEAA